MCKQLQLDFTENKDNIDGIHHAIDEISKEIDETTNYLRGLLYEMNTLKVVDDVFSKLYK